jgi:hypothetical protein
MLYGLVPNENLTDHWLDLYGWTLVDFIEKLRKWQLDAMRARAVAAAGRAVGVGMGGAGRADGRDGTGKVLPLSLH